MENPFEIISERLDRIEKLIEQLKFKHDISAPVITHLNEEIKFSHEELAKYLRVSQSTIHRYKNNKVFPYYKAGRTVFFKKSEVDAAMCSEQPKKRKYKK